MIKIAISILINQNRKSPCEYSSKPVYCWWLPEEYCSCYFCAFSYASPYFQSFSYLSYLFLFLKKLGILILFLI